MKAYKLLEFTETRKRLAGKFSRKLKVFRFPDGEMGIHVTNENFGNFVLSKEKAKRLRRFLDE